MANQQKQLQVDTLSDLLQKYQSFTLVKFEKTLHTTFESLRKELRQTGSKITIVKNSLFLKALNKTALKNEKLKKLQKKLATLTDNTALLLLGEDWSKSLKAFYNFTKKEQSLSFKAGVVDNQVYQAPELTKIAQLPNREELIAKIIGNMKSPVSHLNYALKFNIQKFVYILNAKSKQLS